MIRLSVSGGGGFGPASERDPEAVRYDVENGYISPDYARAHYGHALASAASAD